MVLMLFGCTWPDFEASGGTVWRTFGNRYEGATALELRSY